MACKYTYRGVEYTKNELLERLSIDLFKDLNNENIFRSISTSKKKSKSSPVVSETVLMLNQRYADAKNMLQAIKNSNDSKKEKLRKTAYYKNIMEQTSLARKELLQMPADKQLDYVLDKALADANLVDTIFKSDKITFNELRFANNVVETWSNLNTALGVDTVYDIADEDIKDKANLILNKYRELNERTRQIAIKLLKEVGVNDRKLKETSIATQFVRELSTAGVEITNKLALIIKETNFRINKEHNKNYENIDSKFELIKNHPAFKQMGWDLFIKAQKNKDGDDVLGINTKYSQNFWDNLRRANYIRRSQIEKADTDKEKARQAWKTFNKWMSENTIPFNSVLFINSADHTDVEREAEVSRMKTLGFNDGEVNDIIAESQKFYERFLSNKEMYEERTKLAVAADPSIVPTGISEDDYIKEKVEEYDNLNNPLKYTQQKFTPGEVVTAYGGAKYVYLIAAKEVNGIPSKYYDENFAKIAADPKLYEFYKWYTGFMKENLGWLPEEETDDLQSNFLPVIADRVVKEYGFSALKESVKGLGDWFMKAITANNYEQRIEKAAFSKKERKGFRARFINENVAIEDRSKDLILIAKMFSDMALVYKHKNAISAQVDIINDMVQDTSGSYKMNKKLGELEASAKDASRLKSLADATVNRSFYGLRSEDEIYNSDDLYYDWKELASLGLWRSEKGKKAKIVSDRIIEINKKLDTDDTLTDEQRDKLGAELENKKAEFYKLGGRKFSVSTSIDSSIKGTRLTSLGFAPFSAFRNLVIGKTNNHIHSRGERDFNKKDLAWANKELIQSTGKYWSAGKYETKMTKIILGLMHDSQMAEGEDGIYLQTMIDKNTSLDKFREMLPKAYTWLSSGDYHFKAEMLLAAMKHEVVKTSKGDVSFIDVLNEDREFNEDKYGPWDPAANGNMSFEDFYMKKMLFYKQLANKLHGATGKDVYIQAKDSALGRVTMLFKSWLPETVGVRFDPKHRDALLDRDEEGYYRTFGRILIEKKLGIIKMMIQTAFNKDNGITDPMELANFKKAVREFQIIVGVFLAYLIAKAMTPDDDKTKKLYNMLVVRQLHDVFRDLTYYSNISSVGDLQRNVFPIVRTAENWGSALKAVTYHAAGVENDQGEDMYDNERTALKITKVLPVFSNINRINYYMKGISSDGRGY